MSNIYGGLQYWLNGEPVLPDLNLVGLEHWINGEPYTVIGGAPPPPGNKTYVYYESSTNTFKLVVDNVEVLDITKELISLLKNTKITGSLQVNGSMTYAYATKTADYTLTDSDYQIECTANSFTITLPTAVGIKGKVYSIKNTGTGTITIDGDGAETIDGETTQTLNQWDNIKIISTNTGWLII